jgi:hypothetical protein
MADRTQFVFKQKFAFPGYGPDPGGLNITVACILSSFLSLSSRLQPRHFGTGPVALPKVTSN